MVFHVRKRRGHFCSFTRFRFSNIQGCPQPNDGAVSFSEEENSLLSSLNGGFLSTHPLQCQDLLKVLKSLVYFECLFTYAILNFSWIVSISKIERFHNFPGQLVAVFHHAHCDNNFSNILKIAICTFFLSYISKK